MHHAMRVCMLRFFLVDVPSLYVSCDNRMVGQLESTCDLESVWSVTGGVGHKRDGWADK